MGRYLFRIAYLGTNFTGVQLNSPAGKLLRADRSVSAQLLRCLSQPELRLDKESFRVHSTSRTDGGVHALNNLINIDIKPRSSDRNLHLDELRDFMNKHMRKHKKNIRVLDIQKVSDNMNLRRCTKYRRYIYRLAVARTPNVAAELIHEINLSQGIKCRLPFNVDKFLETAAVLSGKHDFSAFTNKSYFHRPENAKKTPIRTVEIGVKRGNMLFEDLHKPDEFELFEVHIKSRGFLYKQIRRMVRAMIEVAWGQFTVEEIQKILHEPTTYTKNQDARVLHSLGPDGLFLVEVACDPEALQYNEEEDEEDYEDSDISESTQTSDKDTERTDTVVKDSSVLQKIWTKLRNLKNFFKGQ